MAAIPVHTASKQPINPTIENLTMLLRHKGILIVESSDYFKLLSAKKGS